MGVEQGLLFLSPIFSHILIRGPASYFNKRGIGNG